MNISDFDFELPPELIAQAPLPERAASRLLVVDRRGRAAPEHRVFSDVVELLAPGSLLVLNETRVIPARLAARRATGGKAEVLLIRPLPSLVDVEEWEAIVNTGGRLRPGDALTVLDPETGEPAGLGLGVTEALGGGRFRLRFPAEHHALDVTSRLGRMPLPPYIRRGEAGPTDRETYQTVFARVPGAIAAPTAGLHFTPELLQALAAREVEVARVVLHVGLGTFCPIRVERVADHIMHAERYEVPEQAQAQLAAARARSASIVACGTTAVRALEAFARSGLSVGETELFITPGYEFQLVDALITNFHLPRSTLLLLVSAFASREVILAAYAEAVARRYRFFSYGDAMLLR
jgi:S-adenosylmethionine:tRNA ribosyltransferase-isomerase